MARQPRIEDGESRIATAQILFDSRCSILDCRSFAWGLCLVAALVTLGGIGGCRAAAGRVVGQRFISPVHAFEIPLPGDDWKDVLGGQSVLTLAHARRAAGISINVTCERDRQVPLNVLSRHLFFGFKEKDVLLQEPRALNGVPALKTVLRGRLDAGEFQLDSYVIERGGCVYDLVYFARPDDFAAGEADFEQMVAGLRFRD